MYWQCDNIDFTFEYPLIMGIVNVTPDSFSGDGVHNQTDAAVALGMQHAEQGAHIVDVGGESTRPGAIEVSIEEEKRRVFPVIEKLAANGITVSLDTMKPEIMRVADDYGAKIINDVNGLSSPAAVDAVMNHRCGLVVMHKQGSPQTMQHNPQYDNVVDDVAQFIQDQTTALIEAGIDRNRLCVDPGIGFGKKLNHNTTILKNLKALTQDFPVLIGISRKSMFSAITGERPAIDRDVVSAVAAAIIFLQGAHIFRVHNVAMTVDALKTASLIS